MGLLVGPDVGPDHARAGPARQPRGEGLQSLGIEAVAVDHRAVLGEAKGARSRVAGLGQGGDRAALHHAESGAQHGAEHLRALVEPGGETDAIGQPKPGDLDGQGRIVAAPRRGPEARLQQVQRQGVGGLDVQAAQQAEAEVVDQTHGSMASADAASAVGRAP